MHVDFFSATFYSLRKSVKKEYRLLAADQSDYFFECFAIIFIQNLLCFVYIFNELEFDKIKLSDEKNNYGVSLCVFFTTLVLHFSCLYTFRNGMTICKHVVFHSEQFDNPYMAFFLGFAIVFTTVTI